MNTKTKIQTHLQNVDWKQFFKEYLTITFGAFLMILSIDIFFVPAKISPGGGVTGSAIIINHFTGLPVGMLMLLLNIPLVIIGFYYLGRLLLLFY